MRQRGQRFSSACLRGGVMKQLCRIVIVIFFVSGFISHTGYAQSEFIFNSDIVINQPDSKITITYPNDNGVVSGYYIPISWKDAWVERSDNPYPDNYLSEKRIYHVIISELDGKTVYKAKVAGQNYLVLLYDDIKDILDHDDYRVKVSAASAPGLSDEVTFFYKKPFCDIPSEISKEIVADYSISTPDVSSLAEDSVSSLATSSYGCSYCLTSRWGGILIILVGSTTYNKSVSVLCNETVWYSNTIAASYSGPIFINISSGNFKVTYNDFIYNTYACVTVNPFSFASVQFP